MGTTVSKKKKKEKSTDICELTKIYKKPMYWFTPKQHHKLVDQFKVFADPIFYGALRDGWSSAEYFSNRSTHIYVCTIAHDETYLSVDIYADGITRYTDKNNSILIRDHTELLTHFKTQKQFVDALDEDRLVMHNNPWFDVYSSWSECPNSSEECISYDLLDEAIPSACEVLIRQIQKTTGEKTKLEKS